MQFEQDAERRYCRRNPYLHSLYTYALKQSKPVIFISDIYLDESLIRTILDEAGYGVYSNLFVSSRYGESKSNGGLYRVALESLDVPPQEVLHIGDNIDSDVHMARKAGLAVWHYGKCSDELSKAPALERRLATPDNPVKASGSEPLAESIWKGLVINRLLCQRGRAASANDESTTDSFWEDLGYVHVGILYLGLLTWLRRKLVEEHADRVYFLSRDGYIMKEVYERLLATGGEGPSAHYLYASRRAFNLAAIHEMDERHTDFLVSGTSRLTVTQFLGRIGLNSAKCVEEIQSVGLPGPEYRIESGEDYGRLRALFRTLAPGIEAKASDERVLLGAYFKEMGLLTGGQSAVVDIGWHGSLQHSLNLLLADSSPKTELTGYYLATFPPAEALVEAGNRHRGYMAECGQPESMYNAVLESVEILEWIFSANHGSVLRFSKGAKGIQPVLERSEIDKEKTALAQRMQRGALDFVDDFLAQWESSDKIEITPQLASRPLLHLLRHPSLEEARKLGDLPHAEGFGDVYVQRPIAKPSATLFNPFAYRRLAQGYKNSFWRRGYLKRLFLV